MKIILMGPPGSGKGTVAERLVKEFDYKQISPGVLLREEVKKETSIGKEIAKTMESGDLVSDNFVTELVKLEIKDKNNFILDGYPRTIHQAESIADIEIDLAINLEVPEEILIERFSGRRVCPKCGAGYHIKYIKPKEEGICDNCGTALIQRKDDNPETIKERLRVYNEKTQPLIDYYKEKNLLKSVNGDQSPERVYEDVKALLMK